MVAKKLSKRDSVEIIRIWLQNQEEILKKMQLNAIIKSDLKGLENEYFQTEG